MAEQLSLFLEENTLYNIGLQQFLDMDFGASKFSYWRATVPRGRCSWIERLSEANGCLVDDMVAERAYQNWLEFEGAFGHPWPEHGIEQRFQVESFRRIAHGLDTGGRGEKLKLSGGTPSGLIHLRAGRYDAAIRET